MDEIVTSTEARFWSHVEIGAIPAHRPELGPCHVWTGRTTHNGYGHFSVGNRSVTASRYSLEQAIGRPLTPAEQALHECDNPPCVRRLHLVVGTPAENTADMIAKGRAGTVTHPEAMPRGERNGSAKLTADEVRCIRADLAAGTPVKVCARAHGIDPHTVRAIRDGVTWQHVS